MPVVDPDYTKPAETKEPMVQITVSIPPHVRAWLVECSDTDSPSGAARDVLVKAFNNEGREV